MYKIIKSEKLAENTFIMDIEAPDIAKAAKPGQFVMLRIDDYGERVPLTIADWDESNVTVVVQAVGKTTKQLVKLNIGDSIKDFVGPLGNPSEIENFGTVCLVAGGLGIAPIYPQARALKKAGNKVYCIIGGRTKEHIFWRERFEAICEKVFIATDDGSEGIKGNVVQALDKNYQEINPDRVIAVGPPIMMKFVSEYTKGKCKTIASINSIMIDGIGMCGGCRVNVGNEIKFACVDGPEFDSHKVDFDELMNRNKLWDKEEKHVCNLKDI